MAPKKSQAKSPEPKKKTKLKKELMDVLRERAKTFEAKVRVLSAQVAAHENSQAKLLRNQVASEADAEALLKAVRVLAEHVPRDLAACRRAREVARELLEARKIRPPHTLGDSRKRKSKNSRS
jgi:hypothetical protein